MRWLALGFVLTAASAPIPPGFRLPDDAVPLKYTIELRIDPNKETFEGTADIQIKVLKPTSTLWLSGKDLELESVALGDSATTARGRVATKELIAIDGAFSPGEYDLRIKYRGHLDDKAVVGAYRRRVDGNWYVYTTFTPIEARRVFPCFDEPRFKTPWKISIKVPQGEKAFSNAAEIGEEQAPDGDKWIHFAETKPLPSELVAFAVGPFDVYDGKPAGSLGTPIRVITPKGHAAEGKAAADGTVTLLPRLEEYTGIPYPFGKLDHVAEPEGEFGAVENPGLIVYLARELLILPGAETNSAIHALRLLEAHEMGHQWFGDSVTQRDWEDVWLSEGFATWISEKVMDQDEKPERAHLNMLEERERIMQIDDSRRSRPVRVEPKDREGTKDIYNRFVYDKGAAVLLMLEGWLGEDKFQRGIRSYLNEHLFGNATAADLAAALKRASGVDPSAVMHSFLDVAGLPRVSVEVECRATPKIKIRQTGASAIPVCYRGPGVGRNCAVLDGASKDIDLPEGSSCPAWIELNAGGTGYYRTTWSMAQLAALSLKDFSAAERLVLAFDLRALDPRSSPADRAAARAMLTRLASDVEPEVAAAAQEAGEKISARGSSR